MIMKTGMHKSVAVAAGVLALFAVSVFGVWRVGERNARHKTEEMLSYACQDCSITIELIYDGSLAFEADNIIKLLAEPKPMPVEAMQKIVNSGGIDELSVVDRNGVVIAASDSSLVGRRLSDDPQNSEFLVLTNGVTQGYHQTFRPSMGDGKVRRMYSGFPFKDGAFVLCGYDESAAAKHFSLHEGDMMSTWQFGESGCFVVTDDVTRRIRYDVFGFDAKDKTLDEIGLGFVSELPDDPDKTYVVTAFGERCYIRTFHYLGQRIIALVPHREFFQSVTNTTVTAAVVLVLVFLIFGFAFNRTVVANRAITELRAAEDQKRIKDMAMAKSIQHHSLPTNFPPFPNQVDNFDIFAYMGAAKDVGGDFYDFYFVGPGRVALVIADVSGKGVPSAMYMMRAKATLQGLLKSGMEIEAAVAETNDRLCAGNADGMFVTAWVGIYDISTGVIEFVNAGHNPPLVRSRDGKVRWERFRSGLPLATMEGLSYRRQSLKLEVGDAFCLYTDGITEAQNESRELYGESRLETCVGRINGDLSSEGFCQKVLKDVETFVGGAEQADDITLLAFRVKRLASD